jgi:SAM-dependent methyltransferase
LDGEQFDVVLAMHMLYHVADMRLALAELGRVLRRDGVLAIATNATGHLIEIRDLFEAAVVELTGSLPEPVIARFSLEQASGLLRGGFAVRTSHLRGRILVAEREPVMRYIQACRSFWERRLPRRVSWQDVIAVIARRLGTWIETHGSFDVTSHQGVLVCRRLEA